MSDILSVAAQVRDEERAAAVQLRRIAKARRVASINRQREWRRRLADAIRDTRRQHPRCRCELHAGLSREELQTLGAGWCSPQWCCPRLDAVRRRMLG